MPDSDEDTFKCSAQLSIGDSEDEEGDEDVAADFRKLSIFAPKKLAKKASKYRRGQKDADTNRTDLQVTQLLESRRAQHEVLSYTRVHTPKSHVVGFWDEARRVVRVRRLKGQIFRTVGRDVSGGGVELRPEEALYLLERGVLDVRWPDDSSEEVQNDEGCSENANVSMTNEEADNKDAAVESEQSNDKIEDGDECEAVEKEDLSISMSLQGAYATFLGGDAEKDGALTLEKYLVYAGLRRAGYIVLRAEGWNGSSAKKNPSDGHALVGSCINNEQSYGGNLFSWLYQLLLRPKKRDSNYIHMLQRTGPVVKPGLYRSYNDVYRLLQVVPDPEPAPRKGVTCSVINSSLMPQHILPSEASTASLTTTFNIHKPNARYRKTSPGTPAFRICVISARDTSLPTLGELTSLLDEQVEEPPSSSALGSGGIAATYSRIKQGHRNVILAVVDEGIISYMRIAGATEAFAAEKLYERTGRLQRGGKAGAGARRQGDIKGSAVHNGCRG